MILRLEQITRLPKRTHGVFSRDDQKLYSAGVEKLLESWLSMGERYIRTSTDHASNITEVTVNGTIVGTIRPKVHVTKKVLFLPIGYAYDEFVYNGEVYSVYNSGLGRDQHYISIYKGESVIAVQHRDDLVLDYLGKSTLYAVDAEAMELMLIYAMYMEATEFCNLYVEAERSRQDCSYYTKQKELRDKYDPSFIPRIKAMEETSE